MRFLIAIIIFSSPFYLSAQEETLHLDFAIVKAKFGLHIGPFRGRTKETDGPFDQGFAGFAQAYFPFQLSLGKAKDTAAIEHPSSKKKSNIEFNNDLFLFRTVAVLHVDNNGSKAFGIGAQVSFLLFSDFYAEYQVSGVYLYASEAGEPDSFDGFNFHHVVSLSKPIHEHLTFSFSFVHMSGGVIDVVSSNQDVLTLGLKWSY